MKLKCSRGLFVSKSGFTLIELLVVVLIIGILAAVALPQYQKTIYKARIAEVMSTLPALGRAHELHFLETGNLTSDIRQLSVTIPAERAFIYTNPSTRGWLSFNTNDPNHYYYSCDNLYHQCAASAANPSLPLFTYSGEGKLECIVWSEHAKNNMADKLCQSVGTYRATQFKSKYYNVKF